jgi:hypothetical protein
MFGTNAPHLSPQSFDVSLVWFHTPCTSSATARAYATARQEDPGNNATNARSKNAKEECPRYLGAGLRKTPPEPVCVALKAVLGGMDATEVVNDYPLPPIAAVFPRRIRSRGRIITRVHE